MSHMNFWRMFFALLLVLAVSAGCEKDAVVQEDAVTPMEAASMVANRVEHSAYNPLLVEPLGFGSFRSPYSGYGEAVKNLGLHLVEQGEMNALSMQNTVELTVPEEYRTLSAESVDMDIVRQVLRILPGLKENAPVDVYLKRLKLMEYEVLNSGDLLSPSNRDFILKYVSLVRGGYEYVLMQRNQKWGDRWKECMDKKLSEMQDFENPAETLLCLSDWPVCFAAMMADCALSASKDKKRK